ncbi:MAG: LacI family DNA-binding transcriptional regulator [Solirubrobacteraceae bacterium]
MGADRVTSVAVAERAGVSQSTVSLVLSGKARGRVSAATEEAVRRAASELGYRPNRAARALRLGAARMVCLVVPDVTNPFFGQVLRGAARAAREAGFEVVLVDVDRDWSVATESVSALAAGPVDGFLLFGLAPPKGERSDRLVLIELEARGVPSVRFAFEDGVRDAMAHLVALGHRRIAHVASAVNEPTFGLRVTAADAAAAAAGLPPVQRVRSAIDHASAATAARELLAADPRPTAVICDDDIMAAGVCVAAREQGLRVGHDLSVIGCDDLPVASVLDPPLTTLAADGRRIGAAGFELLAAVLEGRRPRRRKLPVQLVVRGSTGPAPED